MLPKGCYQLPTWEKNIFCLSAEQAQPVLPPPYQNTSADFARSKSPAQVLHITELLAALSNLSATASSDICPLSKSLFCKQVIFICTASAYKKHPQTTSFHHHNLPEQPLKPNTAQ